MNITGISGKIPEESFGVILIFSIFLGFFLNIFYKLNVTFLDESLVEFV